MSSYLTDSGTRQMDLSARELRHAERCGLVRAVARTANGVVTAYELTHAATVLLGSQPRERNFVPRLKVGAALPIIARCFMCGLGICRGELCQKCTRGDAWVEDPETP